jgi:hypothetical protein
MLEATKTEKNSLCWCGWCLLNGFVGIVTHFTKKFVAEEKVKRSHCCLTTIRESRWTQKRTKGLEDSECRILDKKCYPKKGT